jgi:hypothetical protein
VGRGRTAAKRFGNGVDCKFRLPGGILSLSADQFRMVIGKTGHCVTVQLEAVFNWHVVAWERWVHARLGVRNKCSHN